MIEVSRLNSAKPFIDSRSGFLLAAFGLMAGTLVLFLMWLLMGDSFSRLKLDYYLLPWLAATAIVLLSPTIYLLYKNKLDIFHPLVHASWSYWFPSIVVGGLFIATDFIQPYQLSLLSDPRSDLVWTCIHVMTGYAAMTLGFYIPLGRWCGEYASRKMPAWDWQPKQVLLPAMVFFSVGLGFYLLSFLSGVVGFSLNEVTNAFSTLYYTLSFLGLEAGFLMAMYIFKSPRIKFEHILAFSLILLLLITRMSLGANRSSILLIVTLLAMAFFYSGRRLTPTTGSVFAALALLSIVGGMIYGTTFRNVKETEDRIGFDQQLDTVGRTLDLISTQDTGKVLNEGFTNLAERIDGISSLGVVVSNYERLTPYEASYGIEGNIFRDIWISFIPRFLWENKPNTSDARAYSDLYFNFNGNSYAITPIGDLLRNYGSLGVPVGMFILGIFLRIIYSALIENQTITIGRATAYYMFLVSLSYEGFYSTILIYGWRILALAFVTFVFANFLLIDKKARRVSSK